MAVNLWQTHLIENSGPNSLRAQLIQSLEDAKSADLAVAFISLKGLEMILPQLMRVASGGTVRIVAGLYQDITEPKALRKLLSLSKASAGNLMVRISTHPQFHAKLYVFAVKDRIEVQIGSANLSEQGLSSNGEILSHISFPTSSQPAGQIAHRFKELWNHQSVDLTPDRIERYAVRYELIRKHGRPKGLPSLRSILGKTVKARTKLPTTAEVRFWKDVIAGYLKPKTVEIINFKTNWDIAGWDWFSANKNVYERGDVIMIIDFPSKHVSVVEVMGRTHFPTPDGSDFVAFRQNKRFGRKRINSRLWSSLKGQKMVGSMKYERDECPRKLMNKSQLEAIHAIFGKK